MGGVLVEFHEAANLFPMMTGDDYRSLRDDIAANGLLEPVTLCDGKILDGRNRYTACLELGIEPAYDKFTGNDPIGFVISKNLHRRHLTSSQRAVIALEAEKMYGVKAREKQGTRTDLFQIIEKSDPIHAAAQAAQLLNTNRQYVSDAKRIEREAPALLDNIRSGEMTIPQAKKELKKLIDPPKPLPPAEAVYSAIAGDNAAIVPQILQVYLPNGGLIADPTWGEGVFWSRVDREKYQVIGSDIEEKPGIERKADFRSLPYGDKYFDAVVFDPPYKLTGTPVEIDRYNNQAGGWRDVMGYYVQGISECYRILKDSGILIVKCMDQVVSGKQTWYHRIVFDIATELGALAEDLIIMVRASPTPQPHERQVHAWKNHSYFWVFRKGSGNGKFSKSGK